MPSSGSLKKAGRTVSFFFFQAEDGIRDYKVTGVQTCALPIYPLGRGGMGMVYLAREVRLERPVAVKLLPPAKAAEPAARRSEEHTSELQSPCNLVCRLLLEKKKK